MMRTSDLGFYATDPGPAPLIRDLLADRTFPEVNMLARQRAADLALLQGNRYAGS